MCNVQRIYEVAYFGLGIRVLKFLKIKISLLKRGLKFSDIPVLVVDSSEHT